MICRSDSSNSGVRFIAPARTSSPECTTGWTADCTMGSGGSNRGTAEVDGGLAGGLAAASNSIPLFVLLRFRFSEMLPSSPEELARDWDNYREHDHLYLWRRYGTGCEVDFRP